MERQGYLPYETYVSGLKLAVKNVWPNSYIREGAAKLDMENPKIAVILCPLYAQGALKESKLIIPPTMHSESRVAGKNEAYFSVAGSITQFVKSIGGKPEINFVFSNKGVLLSGTPQQEHYEALAYHDTLYKDLLEEFCSKLGITHSYSTYSEMGVEFPTFVDLANPLPVKPENNEVRIESKMISCLNQYVQMPEAIVDKKKSREVIKGVMSMNGSDFCSAFWITSGYLAFDHRIPELVGNDGVYLVSERFDPLFAISKLTPALDKIARIQIKA